MCRAVADATATGASYADVIANIWNILGGYWWRWESNALPTFYDKSVDWRSKRCKRCPCSIRVCVCSVDALTLRNTIASIRVFLISPFSCIFAWSSVCRSLDRVQRTFAVYMCIPNQTTAFNYIFSEATNAKTFYVSRITLRAPYSL